MQEPSAYVLSAMDGLFETLTSPTPTTTRCANNAAILGDPIAMLGARGGRRSEINQQALADRRDLVVAADLRDGARAQRLAFTDQQQPVGAVDAVREHHAGLELVDQDFLHLLRQLHEVADLEEEPHGLGIVVG